MTAKQPAQLSVGIAPKRFGHRAMENSHMNHDSKLPKILSNVPQILYIRFSCIADMHSQFSPSQSFEFQLEQSLRQRSWLIPTISLVAATALYLCLGGLMQMFEAEIGRAHV